MKQVGKLFILLVFLATSFVSCEKDEEYQATITVVNNGESDITDFTIANFSKTINTLSSAEEQTFEVKWIGHHSQLGGCWDNSFVPVTIEYFIANKKFDVSNEKGAKIESGGSYYSEKTITNRTNIKIVMNENGYEIVDLN